MSTLLRSSPGLWINLVLTLAGLVVCVSIGWALSRRGASLRPGVWFTGFFLLTLLPQFAGHLVIALRTLETEAPRDAALELLASEAPVEDQQAAAKRLFGPDADAQRVADARAMFGDALAPGEIARFAAFPDGDTVLLARFRGYAAAEKGWVHYLRLTGLSQLDGQGDSQRGYVVTRPVGDRAYVLHWADRVGVWTGADDAAIRRRMAAGGFPVPRRAPLAALPAGAQEAGPSANSIPGGLWAVGLGLYLLLVVGYFFRGAAWAGTRLPAPGVPRASAAELTARLDALNTLEVPYRIERGKRPDELHATWRYGDARWLDLARARRLTRTYRIRLRLDARTATVRATDDTAAFDVSVGHGGSEIAWKASLGILFLHREHHRVLGLRLDEHGRFHPEPSFAYTFDANELKAPLMEAVTRAGWRWRPTVWQGPRWLCWLTE